MSSGDEHTQEDVDGGIAAPSEASGEDHADETGTTEYDPAYGTLGDADSQADDPDADAQSTDDEGDDEIGRDELKKAMGPRFSKPDDDPPDDTLDPDDPANPSDRL